VRITSENNEAHIQKKFIRVCIENYIDILEKAAKEHENCHVGKHALNTFKQQLI
jgi:hypothetical protein